MNVFLRIVALFLGEYLLRIILFAHVLLDGSLQLKATLRFILETERHCECLSVRLSVLTFDDFSLVLEYIVEVNPCEVAVKLLYLRFRLSEREATLVTHCLVVFLRLLQSVQIVILNISSAEFIGNFILLHVLTFALQVLYGEIGDLLEVMVRTGSAFFTSKHPVQVKIDVKTISLALGYLRARLGHIFRRRQQG